MGRRAVAHSKMAARVAGHNAKKKEDKYRPNYSGNNTSKSDEVDRLKEKYAKR